MQEVYLLSIEEQSNPKYCAASSARSLIVLTVVSPFGFLDFGFQEQN
jgi:hypothetical protein